MTEAPSRLRRSDSVVEALWTHAEDGVGATIGAVGDEELDYPAFRGRVAACAALLGGTGVRPGDPVAVEMASTTATLIGSVAVLAAGGVLVPLGATGQPNQTSRDFAKAVNALRVSGARWFLTGQGASYHGALTAAGGMAAGGTTAGGTATVLPLPEFTSAASAAVAGCPDGWTPRRVAPDSPALVQFSSGSLAEPKGIVLTHRNVATNVHALARHVGMVHGRAVTWLPLSHDMGLIGTFVAALYGGSALRVLAPRSFVRDPLCWIGQLSSFGATHTGAPTFAYEMAERASSRAPERLAALDLSAMKAAVIGAERIAPRLCERFEERFARCRLPRHALLPAYGLAENCVAVALREPLQPSAVRALDATAPGHGRVVDPGGDVAGDAAGEADARRRLIGHGGPLPGTDIRITSAQGAPLPEGEVGEIRIGGATACHWFLDGDGIRRPARHGDGFVPTGDLGAVVDGELYVVGRSKETLSYAGRMISPVDVEQTVLEAVPEQLSAAAAVSVPLSEFGDDLVLFLELARRAEDGAASRLADAARLAVLRDFRMPVQDVYVGRRGALPRTSSGKVRRLSLGAACRAGTLGTGFRRIPAPGAEPAPTAERPG